MYIYTPDRRQSKTKNVDKKWLKQSLLVICRPTGKRKLCFNHLIKKSHKTNKQISRNILILLQFLHDYLHNVQPAPLMTDH